MSDIRSELLKKYNVGSSSTSKGQTGVEASSGTSGKKDYRTMLLEKYSSDNVDSRKSAVSNWVKKYNSVMDGYSKYHKENSGRYTKDTSGGYSSKISELLEEYDAISEYADRLGLPNAHRYVDNLRNLQKGIAQENQFMAQFADEAEYAGYMKQQEEYRAKLGLDIGAAQKEIEELQKQRNDYADNHEFDWTDKTQRQAHEQYLQEQDSLINQKKQYLNQAKHIQERGNLEVVADPEADAYDLAFAKLSRYASTEKQDAQWWENPVQDTQYEWINNQNGFREQYEQGMKDMTASAGGVYSSEYLEKGYDRLTQSEIDIYNYYYAKEGKEKAQSYLDSIQESLNLRMAQSKFSQLEDHTALELVFGVDAGLDQFKSGIGALLNTEDGYIPQSVFQMASQMVRGDLADDGVKLPDWMGGGSLAQMGYDAITSTANMAPSILVSMGMNALLPGSGQYVGTALMGASAAGNAYQEALNNGYDKDQAKGYSTLVGASEAVLGDVLGGISALGGKLSSNAAAKMLSKIDNALLRTAGKLGTSMLSEFSEEYLQEVLTPLFSNLTLGTDEKIDLISAEALYSGLLGALTAGAVEGSSVVSGEVSTYQTGTQLQQAGIKGERLAEIGKTMAADTIAYQLAGRVNENTGAYTVGRLFNEIGATLTEQNKADITQYLQAKGMSVEIAQKNAEVMEYIVEGGTLSDTQMKMIEKNDVLAKAMREVIIDPNSTVNQRTQGYADALNAMVQKTAAPDTAHASQTAIGQENVGQENTVPSSKAETAESGYEVSAEGKTILNSTGDEVAVKEIASIKDGKMTLRLEDGTVVDAKDVSYGSEDEALVYETVAEMGVNASAANVLVGAFHTSDKVSAQIYAYGIKEAYRYGQYNYPMREVANGPFASMLTDHQRQTAYKLGQMFGGKQTAKAQAAAKKTTAEKSTAAGKVHYDGERSTLTERQKASISAMETVADTLGVQIYVFASKVDQNGKHIGANGWYDPKDGSIHIDLYAGANGESTMLFTLAHELTHFIKQWSPAKFKTLANFLMQEYGKKGVSVDTLVNEQIRKAKKNNRTISFDTAYEEVIADSMETMLTDGEVMEKLAKLKQQDKSLWQKIKDYISELAAKIRKAYEGMKPDSTEGQCVAEMKEAIERLQEMFTEGIVDASKNYRASWGQKNTAQEGGNIKYSVSYRDAIDQLADGTLDRKTNTHLLVSENTPQVYIEKAGAKNQKIIMGWDIAYLAMNKSGDIPGNYHGLGKEVMKNLPEALKDPLFIVKQNNGRVAAVTEIVVKKNRSVVVSVEFDAFKSTIQDGKTASDNYNIIVTAMDAKPNYLQNTILSGNIVYNKNNENPANFILRLKSLNKALPNDDLARSSESSIRNGNENVNPKFSDRDPDIQRMNAVLEKENAKLKDDVEYLKKMLKLQRSVTDGTKFTRSSVESMAGILMKEANAKGDKKELAKHLSDLYEYIARSEELTWEDVRERAQPAVEWLLENAAPRVQINEYADDILRELRTSRVYLDEAQKKEAAYLYGSYNDYRKQTMGSLIISEQSSVSLDSKWAELSAMYPSVFDPDTTSTDMPAALMEAVDSLRGMRVVEEQYDQKMMASDLLRQVYDGYWRVSTLKTVADVKQKEINRLKYQHTQRMDTLREDHRNSIAKLKKEHREDIKRVKQEYRESAEAKQREILSRYQESRDKAKQTLRDIAMMEDEFIRLAKEYEKQTREDDRKISDLKKAMKKETTLYERDQKLWEQEFSRLAEEYEKADRKIKKMAEKIERQRQTAKDKVESRKRTEMRHKVQKVVNELNQLLLKGTKEKHVPIGLQKAVAEALDAVDMDTVGAEARISKLEAELAAAKNTKEIQEITRKIDRIRATDDKMQDKLKALKAGYDEIINSDDPLIANAYDAGISARMMTLAVEVGDTPLRDMTVVQLEAVYDVYQMVLTTIRNANKTFKAARNATVTDLATNVMREVQQAGGKKQYSPAMVEAIKKFGWNNLKPVYAFEHIGSKTFSEIFSAVRAGEDVWARDVTEARAFYLEKSKQYGFDKWDMEKRYDFVSASGLDFSLNLEQIMSLYAYAKREQAADHLRRGGIVIDESTEVTMKTKLGIKVKFNPTEATAYNISDENLQDIVSKLTPEQKAYVDEMQAYLSATMGEKGNEVSLQMYGIKLFEEKNYFPLKSASQFMAKAKEQQQDEVKIKDSGFSKQTVKKAGNPIVLTPFMNAWASHVNEMSMYHAFVLPMEDFYRVYNYKTPTSDSAATESVEMFIQNAYGKGATRYIDQLLKDLNGGARTDSTTGVINNMMGKFKKGAVFASASVVIQQPSAIARAAALVDLKYFIGGKVDHKRHKLLWEEVKQYAPVAAIKEMGYFDTNMGKSTEDFLLGKEYSGIKEKAEALVKDEGYRDEVLSKAPALADEITWCAIWEAVKRETKAGNPGMDVKSKAFLRKCGERFTEVIVKTQVYDSVLSRSANMRSKDTGMKMATAFMAEPTTAINMVSDALLKARRGDTKFCRRAIGSVVAAQILNAFLVSWVYAARDDDEEKSYAEKYLGNLASSVVDGLNPATYIPFIKDIASITKGYTVERSDMAVISDLWNAWEQFGSDNVSAWRKVEGFTGSICQIFGLPVKNIMRDVRAAYQAFDTMVNGENTTKAGIKYAVQEEVTGEAVPNTKQLYEARKTGDSEHAARVAARYDDEDSANAAVRSAIREGFLEDEIDKSTALKHMVQYAGMGADEAHWTMDSWEYQKANGTEEGYSKYGKFFEAVQSGDDLEAIIQEYADHGVEKETLRTQITSHFKSQYVEASEADRDGMKGYLQNAMELCGADSWNAQETFENWDFEAKHGQSYNSMVEAYKEGEFSESDMKNILITENGLTEEDAQDKLAEWDFQAKYGFSYSDRERAYKEGLISAEDLRTALIEVGGKTEAEADTLMDAMDWLKQNPQYDVYASQVVSWRKKLTGMDVSAEDTGITLDVFLAERSAVNKIESDKDENGNGIPYSRINKAFPYINSLDLTPEQKTALAVACGWELRTVERNKLW